MEKPVRSKRRAETPWRPTPAQLTAAASKRIHDIIDHDLRLLLVGINPGLYSGAIGHHFGRPGNRFWPALHAGGFTPRVLSPFEEMELLDYNIGITNIVSRTTARADELSKEELIRGARTLARKVRKYQPRYIALLGLTSFRTAFNRPKAVLGLQPELFAGSKVWLLPNPSGLNAHHQPADLARLFRELRLEVEKSVRNSR